MKKGEAPLFPAVVAFLSSTRQRAPQRKQPANYKTLDENFQTMTITKTVRKCDADGKWWRIQTRVCPHTGVTIREIKRIA